MNDAPATALTLTQLHTALSDLRLGCPVELQAATASTNDLARQYAEKNAGEGALFLTEYQTSGRGRRGASWVSPAGKNLLFSLLLRPAWPVEKWARLTHVAAVALSESLAAEVDPSRIKIKWPNDLWIDERKIAGLLLETGFPAAQAPYAILGVGLNVNMSAEDWPTELRGLSHSLLLGTGQEHDRHAVLRGFLKQFERFYTQASDDFPSVLQLARQRSGVLGQAVEITLAQTSFVARVVDFGPEGELVVEKADGSTETLHSVERLRRIG
jgi:BirA family transcriptional regulator, biotin operon repressor / biotin---[acetyl-CoA-carboxylase] ligase